MDTRAYLFRMFIDNFMFVFLFYMFNTKIHKKKYWLMLLMVILKFFCDLFLEFTEFIPIIFGYYILKEEIEDKSVILNKVLFCILINKIIFISSSALMVIFMTSQNKVSYMYVLAQISIDYILAFFLLYVYNKFAIQSLIEKYSSNLTILLYTYIIIVVGFIGYTAHKREIFDQFVLGILIFLVLQTLFVSALFIWMTIKQKERYEQKIKNQELVYLKKYTDSLEKDQEQSARFRHDYKNLILSLKEKAEFSQDTALKEKIESLEHYSQPYLTDKFAYRYLKNVKNDYVKSLLISKLYTASQKYIHCTFECPNVIHNIPMDIFDFVRVLGILIDNALEAAEESEQKELAVAIYQDKEQLEISIINSCNQAKESINQLTKKGVTTKKGHSGLGLSNIEEINRKNENMFVNYQMEAEQFIAHVVLIAKEEDL
ncbi:sensor histidine kinase [uncultured Enterococcus sp.]|uniref:sensor histidine kinase n=1 Tax=uncultured Enterococcus sp. TaxID=167972 RepID=UPI0026339FCF|nr:GHKL domain-containing protein [uncultured Enterococcus sp.]